MTAKPNYYQSYKLSLEMSMKINGVDTPILQETFSRGSPAGFLAEDIMAYTYGAITAHIRQSVGYDLLSNEKNRQIEVKAMNRNGVDLKPSREKGIGREANPDFASVAANKDFIVADTSRLTEGEISYVILPGSYVASLGPKTSYRQRDRIFSTNIAPHPVEW